MKPMLASLSALCYDGLSEERTRVNKTQKTSAELKKLNYLFK
jgi:hypothetical protein